MIMLKMTRDRHFLFVIINTNMANTIPDVRIKYAWLLADAASTLMNEKYGDGTPLRSFEEYEQIVQKYREWWMPHNNDVLNGICGILNLEFRQNIIDIDVAPWFSPISDPMVIGPAFNSQDSLINTIAHEMIHRLLTDNTSTDYDHDFVTDWKKLFGENHDWNTLLHIPVHATMKKLYLDVLKRPDLLELDMEEVKENKPYAEAWFYVNQHDYEDIISSLSISKVS
jgi:hypothetical protein